MFGAALPLGSAMAGMAAVFDPLPAAFSVFPCGCCVFAGGLLLTWEVTGLAGRLLLKGTVSRDFRPFFYLKFRPSHLGPIWIVKNGFANFFVFAKIFDCIVRKSGVRIVNTRRTRNFFFRYGHFHIFKLLLLDVLSHPSIFFRMIVHLKSVRRLQSFPSVSA